MRRRSHAPEGRAAGGGTTRLECAIGGKESLASFSSPWRTSEPPCLETGGARPDPATDDCSAAGRLQRLCR